MKTRPLPSSLRAALAAVTFVFATNAWSADTVINFDDLGANINVTNQYASRGVVFDVSNAQPWTRAVADAPSAPNALSIRSGGCTGEFCTVLGDGAFSDPHDKVSVRVGDYGTASSTVTVHLEALDAGNNIVAQAQTTVSDTDPSFKLLSVTTASKVIWRFKVYTLSVNARIAIDDLTFDTATTPTPPDFTLSWKTPGLPVVLERGETRTTELLLHRLGPSSGDIALVASALPTGVTAAFAPNPTGGGDGSTITVSLTTAPDAPPVAAHDITVTGYPVSSAGSTTRSVEIPITVADSFDARIVGIEVTQGAQVWDLPRRGADVSAPVSYLGGTLDASNQPLDDRGVVLVSGVRTVVRVFANLRSAPVTATLPPLEVSLHVCDATGGACGEPLKAELGARQLSAGADFVTDAVRGDPNGAYTFTLPPSATRGTITLKAVLHAPSVLAGSDVSECGALECVANNTFALKDVIFLASPEVVLKPVELKINYQSLKSPDAVMDMARSLLPVADNKLYIPPGYQGQIGITDLAGLKSISLGPLTYNLDSSERGALVLLRLMDRADEWNFYDTRGYVVGVFDGTADVRANALRSARSAIVRGRPESMLGPVDRPLTSVVHELGHLMGRPHASNACGAEGGQEWSPDGQGFLQGFGLDRRGGVWRAVREGSPYRVIAPDRAGVSPRFWDLMSYCGQIGGGDPQHWISPRNWTAIFNDLNSGGGTSGGPPFYAEANSEPDGTLIVRGVVAGEAVILGKVAPGYGPTVPAASSSSYHLRALNAAGALVTEVPMTVDEVEGEAADFGRPATFVSAQLPAAGVEAIEIVSGSQLLASRQRPSVLPAVTLSMGATLDDGNESEARISWTVTNPGGGDLLAKVDYSVDNLPRWRPLYTGPNENQVLLSRTLFEGSRCGRVRVRINDGFNEVSATSGCIDVPDRAPHVRIHEPATDATLRTDTPVYLQGDAFDHGLEPIAEDGLEWFLNGNPVGKGGAALLSGLPVGTSTIELRATDPEARVGTRRLSVACAQDGACVLTDVTPAPAPADEDPSTQPPEPLVGCGGCGAAPGALPFVALVAMLGLRRRRAR